jgi:hypothetical protein
MRGYHPPTDQFVTWDSTIYDETGLDYVGPPRFVELTGVVLVKSVEFDSNVWVHRGYDPAGLEFVYWTSMGYDPTGADYSGPPAFGTLTGVVVLQTGVEAVSAQMLLRLEDTSPDDLNVFEEI